jgi:hypothetical protein
LFFINFVRTAAVVSSTIPAANLQQQQAQQAHSGQHGQHSLHTPSHHPQQQQKQQHQPQACPYDSTLKENLVLGSVAI